MFDWGRLRWIVLALTIGLAIGAVTITPAIGGGLFTKKKALGLFYTKQDSDSRFQTKQDADAKYLTPAGGDSKYLPLSGPIQLQVSPDQWETGTGSGSTVSRITTITSLNAGTGLKFFNAALILPSVLQGRPVQLDSFELCYRVNSGALLDRVFVAKSTPTSSNIAPSPTNPIDDDTDRTGQACRTYAGAGPVSIGAQDIIQIEVRSNNASSSSIDVSRLTVNLSD